MEYLLFLGKGAVLLFVAYVVVRLISAAFFKSKSEYEKEKRK